MSDSIAALPSTNYPVERFTLPNGLRVVLSPDKSAPVIGVVVVYDVGMRSEPEGRTGFAHLFEHLMFQGSENLEKLAHFRYIQSAGGVFNGSTHADFTNYYATLPSHALERTLFLEADRMRAPALTAENLANQIDVVKEEIRLNVKNRPYGGFPWCYLPQLMFDSFANSHDGYGSFEDLEAATAQDAKAFFDSYYAPANAVLAISGDIDIAETTALVEKHFGDIEHRPAPELPSFAEPDLTAERRGQHHDPLAPMPAVALAWRVPDPVANLEEYLPYLLLAEVLTEGNASRLVERLVLKDAIATDVVSYLSFMGDVLAVRDPTALLIQAHYPPQHKADTVIETIESELGRLATDGLAAGELDRVRVRLVAQLLRESDAVLNRALSMSTFEQQYGKAELINEIPTMLAAVTSEQVQAAAATLQPQRRAVLEVVPGKGA
ncbi:MAG: insulinase family protein [Corynebacteriales bacterium]|nr:insulinase family protein [Mycobacteriales bacterium]